MAGNSFGKLFRITTWGESHGPAIGVVIDGCPAGIPLDEAIIQLELDRRKPGASPASTPRKEADRAVLLSGVFEGKTTGCPISIQIANTDARSFAYSPMAHLFRPGHGDFTYQAKYGVRDWRGGGRASARETAARVAAGACAKAVLAFEGVEIIAYTLALAGIHATQLDMAAIDHNPFRCPDANAAKQMACRIDEIRAKGDSAGGIVEVRATKVPKGLGEPVFDKLDADLAHALMGIGAVKGVEIGSGFAAAEMLGSQHNDPISPTGFLSNHAGGILAGISNGEDIVVRVAVKPIPSIAMVQQTVDLEGNPAEIRVGGRHDVAAIPRINPVCEAMVALVLADHYLRTRAISR